MNHSYLYYCGMIAIFMMRNPSDVSFRFLRLLGPPWNVSFRHIIPYLLAVRFPSTSDHYYYYYASQSIYASLKVNHSLELGPISISPPTDGSQTRIWGGRRRRRRIKRRRRRNRRRRRWRWRKKRQSRSNFSFNLRRRRAHDRRLSSIRSSVYNDDCHFSLPPPKQDRRRERDGYILREREGREPC